MQNVKREKKKKSVEVRATVKEQLQSLELLDIEGLQKDRSEAAAVRNSFVFARREADV